MKILIVDDEEVSRCKLTAILEDLGECVTAGSGREAIGEVKKAINNGAFYDLITMDVSMPQMDGTEALLNIRDLEKSAKSAPKPQAKIVMITAQKDRDCLITCVQAGCNDYIIKPVDPDKVFQRLKALKIHGMDEYIQDVAEKRKSPIKTDKVEIGAEVLNMFSKGETNLPSPPGIYKKFMTLIEAGADAEHIADLLKEDIGISFHLISVSNSPVYRGMKDNQNLHQAISRLGLQLTRKYVDLLGNRTIFTTSNEAYKPFMEKLWEHSVACAHAAETLCGMKGIKLDLDMFTVGILHDVGKMVLIQIVSELESRGKISSNENRDDILNTLAAHHGAFGEAVINKWEFPEEFGLIARRHDDLEYDCSKSKALRVIQMANLVTKSMGLGYNAPINYDLPQTSPAMDLNIDAKTIDQIKIKVAQLVQDTQSALG